MTTVDDLCRSYLDLKYHFDPAAASGAGLVAHDSRLGSFDVETVRAQLAALRALTGAAEALEVEDLQDEIDRTALLGELRGIGYRWEHEQPHVRNPGYWLNHLFQAHYAVLSRGSRENRKASAVLERLESVPAFLETARARSTSRRRFSSIRRSSCSAAAASSSFKSWRRPDRKSLRCVTGCRRRERRRSRR